MRPSEAQIQAHILVAVTALPGAMLWRQNTGVAHTDSGRTVRFSRPGTPDILGVLRGRAIGIECKSETGRLSSDQRHWCDAWQAAGGLYVVARSVSDALEALACVP